MLEVLVQNLIEALALVLAGVIATAVGFAARWLIAYLKTKMTAEQFAFLKEGAQAIVRYVEQTALWDELLKDGAAKKERALLQMEQWALEHGIPLTYELADKIIEEAVNLMNNELGGKETVKVTPPVIEG